MMLFRTGDILMVLVMLAAAFWTYEVKYEAQRRYEDVRRIERQIAIEQDSASILRARWALATEPERMEQLAARYHDELNLEIIQPRQIVKIQDIPQKQPDAIEIAIKDSEALIAKNAAAGKNMESGKSLAAGAAPAAAGGPQEAAAAKTAPAGLDNVATGSVARAGAGPVKAARSAARAKAARPQAARPDKARAGGGSSPYANRKWIYETGGGLY